ncbi:5'-3' exoribonuclease 1 isoform X4 [Turdus rufiventris]|nr:5'-3' exoribonuclease 1 isoform X4 [Turdus rufiventris]
MGVPKFYRWISERYPCLSQVLKEHQIPEFDNLYLDMNGIIHQCSHPNDDDVHFRISEDKIFANIFHYLEVLFRIIKPRKVFFMAVDGVAPRAKMNQQRGRRFRSAKEAEEKIKKALEKGETLPTEARFDSNCITPGTEFMARLNEHLKYFVNMKISTDKSWQGITVYLSGHETPGEGEHKIMEFIRSEKAKPHHDPNTRHCLYGLDADLDKISFEYDIERIIDDWILMGFLVGNDFIPHLPHLHINHDALPLLYRTYMAILPELGGYINENGHLNLERFEKYLTRLSDFDREHFSEVFVDLKWFESKVGNKYLNEAAGIAAEEARKNKQKKQKAQENSISLAALEKNEGEVTPKTTLEDEPEDDDLFETEFRQYKRTYYMTKMGVEVVSEYYPYHYAPYLSDIHNISKLKIKFELGKPFMPFEQLLAVLPAASKDLLPKCYQHLMTSQDSPIIEYYPPDFKTDLNGKQQEWEAVVLIPFIDEKRLLQAMESCNKGLKEEEKRRNTHSACLMYWYDKDAEFQYLSPWPEKFPAVEQCHTRYKTIPLDAWHVEITHNKITKINKNALYFCGFPTLKHIKHKFYLKKSGVQVFQQSSHGENMMLEIIVDENSKDQMVENVASSILGKRVFVNWPHLEEARVVAVSDGETKFYLEEPHGTQKLYMGNAVPPTKVAYVGDKEQSMWVKEVQGISEQYQRRKGIIIHETSVVVYAQLLTGNRYQLNQNGEVYLEKQWSKQVLPFVYQTVVKDIKAFDSRFSSIRTLGDLFPPGSTAFMLGSPYYGCMGEVQDSHDVISEGRIRVVFNIPCEPQLDTLIQNQHKYSVKYNPAYILASRLGVSGYLVSRFTGSIFIGRGSKKNPHGDHKANVGLNLKFNKKNEEVPGYTKKVGNEWMYSSAVEQLLAEYLERVPELFNYVAKNSQEDICYEDDIWPGEDENGAEKVQEIVAWLKAHPVSALSRSSCDLQILDAAIVEKIEEEIEKCKQRKSNKKVRVTVKPHLLYRPLEQQKGVVPDRDAEYKLFDRVVNVRENFSVPVGLRGTVIGIKGATRETDVLFEVLFDEEFLGGLTIRVQFYLRKSNWELAISFISQASMTAALNVSKENRSLIKSNFAGVNKYNVKLLKRNGSPNMPVIQKAAVDGPCTSGKKDNELESLLASLKISKENEVQTYSKEARSTNEEHLSPQSFAMKGTQMLKEILKIDGSDLQTRNEVKSQVTDVPAPASRQDCHGAAVQYRPTKKMAAYMNKHSPGGPQNTPVMETGGHPFTCPQPALSTVSELSRVCSLLGMSQPDFSFLKTPQTMTVCHIKLSNGLLVHGPQCHSEAEAKEKAALFALQRLGSIGVNFASPPPVFPNYQPLGVPVPPGSIPPVFAQPPANMMPPSSHMFGPVSWGAPVPKHYYPGSYPGNVSLAGTIPVGSHNQFIPLQVTKKRAASKKNFELKEFQSSPQAAPLKNEQPVSSDHIQQDSSSTPLKSPQAAQSTVSFQDNVATPSVPHNKSTPNTSSKRKPRKLAVNFGAPKSSE